MYSKTVHAYRLPTEVSDSVHIAWIAVSHTFLKYNIFF